MRITEDDYVVLLSHEWILSSLLSLRQIDTLGSIQPETDRKIRQARIILKEALKELRIDIIAK